MYYLLIKNVSFFTQTTQVEIVTAFQDKEIKAFNQKMVRKRFTV